MGYLKANIDTLFERLKDNDLRVEGQEHLSNKNGILVSISGRKAYKQVIHIHPKKPG